MSKFIIKDWADNLMNFGTFNSYDDAEEFLCEKLDELYETNRQEYVITDIPQYSKTHIDYLKGN